MPPFYNDEQLPRTDYDTNDDEIASILSHKTLSYVKIETKVADAETLSTRLLEDDIDEDDGNNKLLCVSFDSKHPFLILSCFYMILVTINIIILSSTEDFDSNDNWWKICNIINVISGYLGIVAAIYRSKLVAAIISCWWLFEMFFGMFRLALMHWGIIPDTAVRAWFIVYTVISYVVRLLLMCSAIMFVSQNNDDEMALT
eukprot:scaffold27707_cov166-Skeletonema_menzelii.AAC.3